MAGQEAAGYFWANDPNINMKLRERIAMQMLQNQGKYPKTIGEGLTAVGQAYASRQIMDRLAQADVAAQQGAKANDASTPFPSPTAPSGAGPAAAAPAANAVTSALVGQQGGPGAVSAPFQAEPDPAAQAAAEGRSGLAPSQAQAIGIPSSSSPQQQVITPAPAPPQNQIRPISTPERAGPEYITPMPQKVVVPQRAAVTPYEARLQNMIAQAKARGDDYTIGYLQPKLDRIMADRAAEDARRVKQWEVDVQRASALEQKREDQLHGQAKAIQDHLIRSREVSSGPGAGASVAQPGTAAAPMYDSRLGTAASPQRTGQPAMPPIPANTSEKEWAEKQVPELINLTKATEKAVPEFQRAIDLIDAAYVHPGRDTGVGPLSVITGNLWGTRASAFQDIIKQMAAKNFLVAYEHLKGGGGISTIEGDKATAAQARLATARNPDDFWNALKDLNTIIREDMERAQRKVNKPVTAWNRTGDRQSSAPDIGQRDTRKGVMVEYIGGNPALDSSYRPLQ